MQLSAQHHKDLMSKSTPINIAGTVVRDKDGRYLMVKEKRADIYGLWNIPAGHQDKEESLQQAAIRETYEEVGLKVELITHEPIYIGKTGNKNHIFHAFPARIIGGELNIPKDEIIEVKWLVFSDILKLNQLGKIRNHTTMTSIRKVEDAYSRH